MCAGDWAYCTFCYVVDLGKRHTNSMRAIIVPLTLRESSTYVSRDPNLNMKRRDRVVQRVLHAIWLSFPMIYHISIYMIISED